MEAVQSAPQGGVLVASTLREDVVSSTDVSKISWKCKGDGEWLLYSTKRVIKPNLN